MLNNDSVIIVQEDGCVKKGWASASPKSATALGQSHEQGSNDQGVRSPYPFARSGERTARLVEKNGISGLSVSFHCDA